MPIYEYLCEKCGSKFEYLVRNADEKVKCTKCSSPDVRKELSRFTPSVSSVFCKAADSCPSAGSSHACGHGGGCGCGHSH